MRNTVIESHNGQLMSKTQHYRKVTKPLLERKRRARMNHYLDELKNLIVETMEAQGEHITKLEKADILEMTVTYLKSKNELCTSSANESNSLTTVSSSSSSSSINPEKFRAGYTQAAYEVSKVFASVPGLDVDFGTKLMKHLGYKLKDLQPPKQLLSTIDLHQSSRSTSPSYNNQNKFGFGEKSHDTLHQQHSNEEQQRMIVVITPPQSPNLIRRLPLESSSSSSKFNDSVLIDKKNSGNMEKQMDQQSSGDVWRPW